MERKIVAGDLKIASFFDDVKVNFVPEEVLKKLDAGMLSFFNVNTQRDLDRALALVAEGL
jgi:molybdopterin-guanine dinucleotide biosynthesis protein A